jgi:hypothetical protein
MLYLITPPVMSYPKLATTSSINFSKASGVMVKSANISSCDGGGKGGAATASTEAGGRRRRQRRYVRMGRAEPE